VFLSYYDENTKKWVYAGGEVDTNRNVVILETTHASWWMPTTWNWGAWIAVLNKILRISIVDWIEAVQLVTDNCPRSVRILAIAARAASHAPGTSMWISIRSSISPEMHFWYLVTTIEKQV
jgi:hypothetical protein